MSDQELIARLRAMVSDDGCAIVCNGRTTRQMATDILDAADRLEASRTPEGMVMVPRVITEAMRDAIHDYKGESLDELWNAMLSASQTPSGTE